MRELEDIFWVTQSHHFKSSDRGKSSTGLEIKRIWVLLHKPLNFPQILMLRQKSYLLLLKPETCANREVRSQGQCWRNDFSLGDWQKIQILDLLLLYIYVCMYLAYFVYGYGETRRDEIQDPDVLCWTFCSNFALISSYKMTSITGPGLHVNWWSHQSISWWAGSQVPTITTTITDASVVLRNSAD